MNEEIYKLKETEKLESETKADNICRPGNNWSGGVILIVVGSLLLLGSFTGWHLFQNWWAFFILIPAVSNLSQGMERAGKLGRLDEKSLGSITCGLMLGFVAAVFLFGLSWGILWPLFLIVLGLGALLKVSLA